ncbi:agmatinase [Caldithrix abyssi DSM 13497]|uniref:Agmatinase n=1 Tax=Caldithrix abyssi DSM 13497 TaxID=880073 RepID=H1XYW0_CALAY|nr:agmatinase [Caldithrix abyssi]APF17981.1 agmatinase [Caldithrix abyssi DSM 13497]EHO42031.1 agmatinase [Caldithrix abyssi DSM 13497]
MKFLQGEAPEISYQKARTAILPVPYERTTSFEGGTARGPQAAIAVSPYLETYDEELDVEIWKAGIFTLPALNFGEDVQKDFDLITRSVLKLIEDQKFVVAIGGEHSISYPLFRAFHQKFPDISVLQLDAHADLRESYQGTPFSHASVMKRIFDLNQNLVQLGIRALSIEEREFIKQKNIKTVFAHQMYENWPDDILTHLSETVYLTIDVDFFDPALMPGTGTPEPGGFFWPETLKFLKTLFKTKNVVGMDVVELRPLAETRHSEYTVARLIYKLIGYKFFLNR